jgi:hypothetical protein
MNNPHAFPKLPITRASNGEILYQSDGMTLRDYFAAKAMQGLMSGRWKSDIHGIPYDAYRADADEWAKSAYHFADAMLKAREA